MAKTIFNKNGLITISGLTLDEFDILAECLSRCQDAVSWDEEENVARDNENFLWEIDDRKMYDTLQGLSI